MWEYVEEYLYKLTVDDGGAPCVHRGLLSLAICKPMIRKTAVIGDVIFGFAAKSLSSNNRLIYVARITDRLTDGIYYKSRRYFRREDCIYQFKDRRFSWRSRAKHHGSAHLIHDLGRPPSYPRTNVLLSKDFRYFGRAGTDEYKWRFPLIKNAVERLGQGLRVHHDPALRRQLLAMADWVFRSTAKKKIGEPTSAPSGQTCHRIGPCRIV